MSGEKIKLTLKILNKKFPLITLWIAVPAYFFTKGTLILVHFIHKKLNWTALRLERLDRKLHSKSSNFLGRLVQFFEFMGQKSPTFGHLIHYDKYLAHLKYITSELEIKPKISIIMPVYKVKTQHLIEAIDSVIAQTYGDWELCIVDDHSEDEKIHRILQEYQKRFPEKIKCQFEKINHHISEASNIALKMSTGSYISFLDHDDRLYPNALGEVVRYINLYQNPDILYSDERNISENGEIQNLPFYKPDFSPFLHLSVNYTTHFSTYSRKIYEKIGGLRRGFEGSQDHDFMLRATEATDKEIVHIPFLLYQWRIHPGSSAQGIENKSYAIDAGIKAVSEALHRRKMPGKVGWDTYTQRYRLHLDINGSPKISILIPNKNSPVLLKKCLNSIFEKSTYENFEIIVIDNQSDNQNLQELYSTYLKQYSNFKVVEANFPFNFAKINNLGTSVSTGEYLIFLNNDTEVITNNWIEELLMFAQQPKIGTVGAKLLFEDHTIQHAGIGTFGRMIAGHPGVGLPALSNERYNLYNTVREVIAVTAACMMIKRKSFEDIGMFDEKWCPNGWGDVEFGLRAHEKGYQSIFTPYATLYHSESKTRGVSIEFFEHEYLMNRYPALLLNDPYSNHNLAQNSGFEIHDTRRFELHNRDFVRYLSEHQKDHSSQ